MILGSIYDDGQHAAFLQLNLTLKSSRHRNTYFIVLEKKHVPKKYPANDEV